MALNNAEIADRVFRQRGKPSQLSIVPEPDEKSFTLHGGASIDLRLGRWFRTMKQANIPYLKLDKSDSDGEVTKEIFIPFSQEFYLHPGKFVLGITLEWISLPGDIVAFVTGKSSLGRRGLIIETSAGVHPGFAGCLTLELANVGEIPIALVPGMEICQIFFHQTPSMRDVASSQFKGRRKPGLGIIMDVGT
jgi:dCTP deaminase